MELKKYIKIYDNFINYETLSILIRYINCLEFKDAHIGGELSVNKEIRNTFCADLSMTSDSLSEVHWHNYLANIFSKGYLSYSKEFGNFSLSDLEIVQILKYEQGGFYIEHTDHFNLRPRTLSGIFLLNNDYEGGELCFRLDNKDYVIEKKPNRFIVWPSNFMFPHRVNKVTKGVRYSAVSWIL